MEIESPQHWCQGSIEHLAPWVWLMQSVITLWYLTEGHESVEARKEAALMGEWDSPWSLRHMLKVLRRAILNKTINPKSAQRAELISFVETLKNCVNSAA